MSVSIRKILLFLVLLIAWSGTCAAELEDGIAAYDRNDFKQALSILQPLANNGDPSAQFTMGLIAYNGLGAAQDYSQAMKWFLGAASKNLAAAEYCVGVMHAHGQGVTANQKTALDWYKRAANKGYPAAFHNLGVQYAQGRGAPSDYVVALAYLIVATDLGVPEAASKRDTLLNGLSEGEVNRARVLSKSLKAAIKHVPSPPLPATLFPTIQAQG